MSIDKATLLQKLVDHESNSYSFFDILKTLHECTDATNTRDAMNAWLRIKRELSEYEFLGHMIDACVFYHLMKVARTLGNDDHVADLRSRMVQSWNQAVGDEDIDSIMDVDQIVPEDVNQKCQRNI